MKTVILAGGRGSRLAEETDRRPKPMIPIGEAPILWHIAKIYSSQGFKEFVIATGYRGDVIKDYLLNYRRLQNDFSIRLDTGELELHGEERDDWLVHVVDTGLETGTGGRVKRLAPWIDSETFMLTYGDGVADVDIGALLELHRRNGKLATVTAVRPPARFGGLVFEGELVREFSEKPQIGEGWISGGFFVLEPAVLDYIEGDETLFEREPLERLAREGQLAAYRHEGFWQGMDTLRDLRLLEQLWQSGQAPWKVWE
jgi:glucose-1-phosphate cytidylyltransferase